MAADVPARYLWALELLQIEACHHVLEIGCGTGAMADLVAQRIGSGSLVAVDRSPAMVARAKQRNALAVAEGKVTVELGDLAKLRLEPGKFDKVFAMNVNLFWTRVKTELQVIARAMAPGGKLSLFYEPPGSRAKEIAGKAVALLNAHAFEVTRVIFAVPATRTVVCIEGRPRPDLRETAVPTSRRRSNNRPSGV